MSQVLRTFLLLSVPIAIAIAPAASQTPPSEVSPPGSSDPLLFTDKTTLVWEPGAASDSDTFNLYRGDLHALRLGDFVQCKESLIPSNTTTDVQEPFADTIWAYLVSGENPDGEGPLSSRADFEPPVYCFDGIEICDNDLDDDGNGLIDCHDPACAQDLVCSNPVCDCIGPCDPNTPDVQAAAADPRHLVQDWAASLSVSATDPLGLPLTYDWETNCPGNLNAAGGAAELMAYSVGLDTPCQVTVDVVNDDGLGQTCTIPLSIVPGEAIEQSQVHLIGPDHPLHLIHSDDTTMTFLVQDDIPPSLVPGNMMVVAQEGGGIRRILGSNYIEPHLIVDTEHGRFSDVVYKGETSVSWELAAETSSYPGEALMDPLKASGPSTRGSTSMSRCATDYHGTTGETHRGVWVGATITGITFEPTLHVTYRIDIRKNRWGIPIGIKEEMRIWGEGDLTIEALAGIIASAGASVETSIDLVACNWYPVFTIGPVVVPTKIVLAFEAGASASVLGEASLTQDYEFNATALAGVKLKDGSVSPISGYTQSFTAHAPELSITAEANAEVTLGPRIEVLFYHIVGPILRTPAYLGFEANVDAIAQTYDWSVPAGFRGEVGGKIDLIAWDAELTMVLFDIPFADPLISGSNEALDGDYTLTVVNNGPGGRIYSPQGIDCGSACVVLLPKDTVVELIPVATAGWQLDGYTRNADCADGRVTIGPDVTCEAHWSQVQSPAFTSEPWDHGYPGVIGSPHFSWNKHENNLARIHGRNFILLDSLGNEQDTVRWGEWNNWLLMDLDWSPERSTLAIPWINRAWVARHYPKWPDQSTIWSGNVTTIQNQIAPEDPDGLFLAEWSPFGDLFAVGNGDGEVFFWDKDGHYCDEVVVSPGSTILDLDWAPNDTMLVAAVNGETSPYEIERVEHDMQFCEDNYEAPGSAIVFQTGSLLPPACDSTVSAVAWSPDQRILALGCQSGDVVLWENPQRVVPGMQLPTPTVTLTNHSDRIHDIGWHPDGTMVATVDNLGCVSVFSWDGQTVIWGVCYADQLVEVEFSPDGSYLTLSGAVDSRVWVVD